RTRWDSNSRRCRLRPRGIAPGYTSRSCASSCPPSTRRPAPRPVRPTGPIRQGFRRRAAGAWPPPEKMPRHAKHQPPGLCSERGLTGRRRNAMKAPDRRQAMDKFTVLEGVAAPLKMINVDTDMIIPKQYLKTIKRTGLGKGLFSELRYREDGSENPDFVLNKPAYRKARILVADENF